MIPAKTLLSFLLFAHTCFTHPTQNTDPYPSITLSPHLPPLSSLNITLAELYSLYQPNISTSKPSPPLYLQIPL
jgi:hypothetical protein